MKVTVIILTMSACCCLMVSAKNIKLSSPDLNVTSLLDMESTFPRGSVKELFSISLVYELSQAIVQYWMGIANVVLTGFEFSVPIYKFVTSIETKRTFFNAWMQYSMDCIGEVTNIIMTGDVATSVTAIFNKGLKFLAIWQKTVVRFLKIPNIMEFIQSIEKAFYSTLNICDKVAAIASEILPKSGPFHDMAFLGVHYMIEGNKQVWKSLYLFPKTKGMDALVRRIRAALKTDFLSTDPKQFLSGFKEIVDAFFSFPVIKVFLIGCTQAIYGTFLFAFGIAQCFITPLKHILAPEATVALQSGLESLPLGMEKLRHIFSTSDIFYQMVGLLGPAFVSAVGEESKQLSIAVSNRDFESIFTLVPLITNTIIKVLGEKAPEVYEGCYDIYSAFGNIWVGFSKVFSDVAKKAKEFGGLPEIIADGIQGVGSELLEAFSEGYLIVVEALETGNFMEAKQRILAIIQNLIDKAKPYFGL